jgi:hypothetical protein
MDGQVMDDVLMAATAGQAAALVVGLSMAAGSMAAAAAGQVAAAVSGLSIADGHMARTAG